MWMLVLKILGAFWISVSFGACYRVRGFKLVLCGICGSAGYTAYLLTQAAYSEVPSLVVASSTITLLSEIMARINKAPVTLFSVAALIPLVPGGGMYYTMAALLNNDPAASQYAFQTLWSCCAIVIGILVVSTAFNALWRSLRWLQARMPHK